MKNNINYNINENIDDNINNNINFFIDLKLNVNDLINASNRLIVNHEQNEEFINKNENENENENEKKLLNQYSNVAKDIKNKIDTLKILLEMTKNYIQNTCKHQIEHDYIDITPDKMINISYCSSCGHNFI
jgi:hypothetical protein